MEEKRHGNDTLHTEWQDYIEQFFDYKRDEDDPIETTVVKKRPISPIRWGSGRSISHSFS